MTTFNYLTRAAKDRVLHTVGSTYPDLSVVAGSCNLRSNVPYVTVKGYCGALENLYMPQISNTRAEIWLQNIFSDNYQGVSLNQNNSITLMNAGFPTLGCAFDPAIMPVPPGTTTCFLINPMTLVDRITVVGVVNAVETPLPDDTRMQMQFSINRDKRVS
jgi:hypothetical protein